MTQFEFVFLLYMLILGLSFVELLTGFGNALERQLESRANAGTFSIGWLTPLLAAFVIMDLLSFWAFAWGVRDHIEVTTKTLLGVMLFASSYFLAARLVFPRNVDALETLDTHYFRVRRIVLAILTALVVVQWLYIFSLPDLASSLNKPVSIGLTLVLIGLMLAAMFVKSGKWSIVLLVLLILRYAVIYVI